MANRLVKLSFLALCSNLVLSNESEDWKNNLLSTESSRCAFGESALMNDEADSIKKAKLAATAELAKSFSISIKSDVVQESTYSQESSKNTKSYKAQESKIIEQSNDINLIGVNSSNYHIDREHKLVIAAAIVNLKDYENYLRSNISMSFNSFNQNNSKLSCETFAAYKQLNARNNYLVNAERSLNILNTFSFNNYDLNKQLLKNKEHVQTCREKFPIYVKGLSTDQLSIASSYFTKIGYVIKSYDSRSPASIKLIAIDVSKDISSPEVKFDRLNLTGQSKIVLKIHGQDSYVWNGKIIRQIDIDEPSAKLKLNVRLDDDILEGLKEVIEKNI